ncbi:hypothetical protein TNIN_68061 [Trichonephila inaurata madagascariensis]|uniref:Enolase C-terminal domain-containing protein n=1 Tax=Trichonephila inaurata madagascariensis TaxID=2747483 RepID=A0A8X6Y449_9ARAC|nr:hypothetical protein TNIN_68061 [Trichonephila inaurata madagascariensis]
MVDANQKWDVKEAIDWMKELTNFNLLWIEEPTSPDDILGHAAISKYNFIRRVSKARNSLNALSANTTYQQNKQMPISRLLSIIHSQLRFTLTLMKPQANLYVR